jgi:type III pantothenate kinase
MSDAAPALLAINVGNTRTSFAVFRDWKRESGAVMPNADFDALSGAIRDAAASLEADDSDSEGAIVIASVNDSIADRLEGALRGTGPQPYRVGRDIEIPMLHALDASGAKTVGQDRLLSALAAFKAVQQACVVIDAGTAVTVDFVDGEGVFQGGAIAPGAGLMLRALREHTAALPEVPLTKPGSAMSETADPFGRNTAEAMLNGAYYGVRGMVRALVERYAEAYQAYPRIIATGGDAELLFEGDDLVERIVPDLTLWGIAATCRAALTDDEDALGSDAEGGGCGTDGCGCRPVRHHKHERRP